MKKLKETADDKHKYFQSEMGTLESDQDQTTKNINALHENIRSYNETMDTIARRFYNINTQIH